MLVALDVAILPPPEISRRAIEVSAALPGHESRGLRLGDDALPHITLTQQFVHEGELPNVLESVAITAATLRPLHLTIPGTGGGSGALWMVVSRTPELSDLHVRLMDALQRYEQGGGTAAAFVEGDARAGDVDWVSRFRDNSAYERFNPHITLGHGTAAPALEPMTFTSHTIAVCQLGRFCTCRHVLRRIELRGTTGRK